MRIFLIDNRDSFTYNLAHAFQELSTQVTTVPVSDLAKHLDSIDNLLDEKPERTDLLICIGPGPRAPDAFPALTALIQRYAGKVPIFGVCLGMQALAEAFDGHLALASQPLHGKTCHVRHDGAGMFDGLPSPMRAMRYNSIVVKDVPSVFHVKATDADGQIMAMEHSSRKLSGVQFHPESIGTEGGLVLLRNVLAMAGFDGPHATHRVGGIPPPRAT